MNDDKNITIYIDGKECIAKASETIIQAATRAGVYIPSLCYYDGIKPTGACRICTVNVNGRPVTACTTKVADGMIIENDIPELNEMRKTIIELLIVEGNHYCMFCEKSGNCDLQALAYRFKILAPRFNYEFPDRQLEATKSKLLIDRNRCVLCKRCVQEVLTDEGKQLFALSKRGNQTQVNIEETLIDEITDDVAEKAMSMCPVGAIIKKQKGYSTPIGERKYDKAPIGSKVEAKV